MSEEVAAPEWPAVGSRWEDSEGRVLYVIEVAPGDPLGREVRGKTLQGRDYATDYNTFDAIWRQREPLASFRQ